MCACDVFSSDYWTRIIQAITNKFTGTMPREIVGSHAGVMGYDKKDNENDNRDVGNDGGRNTMDTVDSDGDVNGHGNDLVGGGGGSKDRMMDDEDDEDIAENNKIEFHVVRYKCVAQLLLIEVVHEVVVSILRAVSVLSHPHPRPLHPTILFTFFLLPPIGSHLPTPSMKPETGEERCM